MFSLILSILIIDNKVNDNIITKDFYNFAVFCLIYDMLILLYNFVHTYLNGFHIHITSSFFIYLIAFVETVLILKSGIGNKVSDESYVLAIIFLVIEILSILIKNKHRLKLSQFNKKVHNQHFKHDVKRYEYIGKITHPKNRKMTARYI